MTGRYVRIPGFYPLNWYAWNLNDAAGRTCWDRGDSLRRIAAVRLSMLRSHRRWFR